MRGACFAVLLTLPVLLGACSTYQAAPLEPSVLLQELRDESAQVPEGALAADDAVALALVHNPALRLWRTQQQIAAELVVSQSAWENPEFRVSLDRIYSRVNDPFRYALDLRFFPPAPGEMDAKRARAVARERRVLARIEDRESELARDTRLAHARLVLIDEQLRIVRTAVRLHERLGSLVQGGVRAGLTTRIDATLVSLRSEEVADELASLESGRDLAQADLAALLGAPPDARIEVRATPGGGSAHDATQAELEDEALAHRPDLRALAAAYQEREHQLELRHLARTPWPRHVQAGYGGLPSDTSFDVDIAIEVPIFDTVGADIAVAESRRDRARESYRQRLHEVRGEIRRAQLDLREQRRRRGFLASRVEPVVKQAEELVASALEAGAADARALLAIEQRVLDARHAEVQATHDHQRARIRLAAATGTVLDLP